MGIRPIRLLRDWSVYTAGQVLTPPGGFASALIDRGVAEDYKAPEEPKTLVDVAVNSTRRGGWPKGKPRKPRGQPV